MNLRFLILCLVVGIVTHGISAKKVRCRKQLAGLQQRLEKMQEDAADAAQDKKTMTQTIQTLEEKLLKEEENNKLLDRIELRVEEVQKNFIQRGEFVEALANTIQKQQENFKSIESALNDFQTVSLPVQCSDIRPYIVKNGTYTIYPYGTKDVPVTVYCLVYSTGRAWTVIQRRFNGSVNFFKGWDAYKKGFGSEHGEYWLGNDLIHVLTSQSKHSPKLRIVMSDFEGGTKYAQYSSFRVGDELQQYQLSVGGYSGNAGDSFTAHNGSKFTTFDTDNDGWNKNCAEEYDGAWWYSACHVSNLNGQYLGGPHSSSADGVNWKAWKGYHYSLKTTTMMIREH